MNRRTLLTFIASLPVAAASPAAACSVALTTPRSSGLQNGQVRALFTSWFARDEDGFQSLFTDRLMNDGTAMAADLADDLLRQEPVPAETLAIFGRFFADESQTQSLALIVNTLAGIIAGVSESPHSSEIGPDCSGMPKLHLFLIAMNGLTPRAITHVATEEGAQPNAFGIWTEG